MMDNDSALNSIKQLYLEMHKQHAETADTNAKESKIKSGLLLLYFWAIAHQSEPLKHKLKQEAENIFKSVGNFFVQAEIDYQNLLIERPDIIDMLENMDENDYNKLISFIQNDYRENNE